MVSRDIFRSSFRGNRLVKLDDYHRVAAPNKEKNEHVSQFKTVLMPIVCESDISEQSSRVDLMAFDAPLSSIHYSQDPFLVADQDTLILPVTGGVIGRTSKPGKRKVGEKPVGTHATETQSEGGEAYSTMLRKLAKSSGIYALSSMAAPLVSLLLAPFLTHHLSHAEYGALAVLNSFVALIAGVTQLGLSWAFIRAYTFDYDAERDRLDALSTFVVLLLTTSTVVSIIALVAAPTLSVLLLNTSSLTTAIRFSALAMLLQNLSIPGLTWLRVRNRPAFYSTLSILNLMVSASATIYLIEFEQMGINGALLATGAGYAVIAICTLPIILLRAGIHLRLKMAREMLLFGWPNVLNLIAGWVLQLIDRYLLVILGSLAQTASYSAAYSLGGAMAAIIIAPFSLAWLTIMFTIAKRDDALRVFQLIFRWYCIILLFGAFGVSLFGVGILYLFFPSSYHSSASIIPVIALSMVFNGIFVIMSVGSYLKRKPWLSTIAIASAALINTILNLFLIPLFGAMGAALATLVAYIALSLITRIINQHIYPVPFEIGWFLLALLVGVALYSGSNFLAENQQFYLAWGIRIGSLILYGGCLVLLGLLPNRNQKKAITNL